MKKRNVLIIMILAFSLLFAGCNAGGDVPSVETSDVEPDSSATPEVASNDETVFEETEPEFRIVVDHLDREVKVPANIERIVIDGIMPLPATYALFEGSVDKLVGIESASMSAAKGSLLEVMFPDITSISTEFNDGDDVNIEALLELKPDVIFYRSESENLREKFENCGIPAIAFSTAKYEFNTIETFKGWITLLGNVLGQEDKAAGIVEKANESFDMVQERVGSLEDTEKPRVLMINKYDENQLKIYGNGHFSQFWIESTGGVNVAADLKGMKEVNLEQIYEYNPDIIYISNFTTAMPEDILNSVINNDDWSSIKAVADNKVYKMPLGTYRWYPPSPDVALTFKFLASHNHPELFEDINMQQEAAEYYKDIFGINVSDEILEKVFNPSREAGTY